VESSFGNVDSLGATTASTSSIHSLRRHSSEEAGLGRGLHGTHTVILGVRAFRRAESDGCNMARRAAMVLTTTPTGLFPPNGYSNCSEFHRIRPPRGKFKSIVIPGQEIPPSGFPCVVGGADLRKKRLDILFLQLREAGALSPAAWFPPELRAVRFRQPAQYRLPPHGPDSARIS